MQSRSVRVSPTDITVQVDEREGTLANLSLAGALIRVDHPIPIGQRAILRLSNRMRSMVVNAGVCRVDRHDVTLGSWIAFEFAELSDADRRAIPLLVSTATPAQTR